MVGLLSLLLSQTSPRSSSWRPRELKASVVASALPWLVACTIATLARGDSSLAKPFYSTEAPPFSFVSDMPMTNAVDLRDELLQLQHHLAKTLGLERPRGRIVIFLSRDRNTHEQWIRRFLPHLPHGADQRDGLFLLRRGQPYLFLYWGEHYLSSLRHEFVHVLLHHNFPDIPLWLDEGLAVFHETGREDGWHPQWVAALAEQHQRGWSPDLARLEKLTTMTQLHPQDYREAWSWVHWLLVGNPNGHQKLRDYFQLLSTTKKRPRFTAFLSISSARRQQLWLEHFGWSPHLAPKAAGMIPQK